MPPTTDDPVRNLLPTFAAPPMSDLGTEAATPSEQEESSPTPNGKTPRTAPEAKTRRLLPDGAAGPDVPASPRRDDEPTRTAISSVSKPSAAEATALMVGVVGLVVTGVAFVVRLRTRRKLREPTAQQRRDIAAPLGRILLRRADLTLLGPDIADLLQAGAATGAYLGDGDLLGPLHPDAGVPDNLQEFDE